MCSCHRYSLADANLLRTIVLVLLQSILTGSAEYFSRAVFIFESSRCFKKDYALAMRLSQPTWGSSVRDSWLTMGWDTQVAMVVQPGAQFRFGRRCDWQCPKFAHYHHHYPSSTKISASWKLLVEHNASTTPGGTLSYFVSWWQSSKVIVYNFKATIQIAK